MLGENESENLHVPDSDVIISEYFHRKLIYPLLNMENGD